MNELTGFEAGPELLTVLRCVMSRSDMSDLRASWCEQHDITLELLLEAHHKLAIRERNHAVRRNQVLNCAKMYPQYLLYAGRATSCAKCERILSHINVFWDTSHTFLPRCRVLKIVSVTKPPTAIHEFLCARKRPLVGEIACYSGVRKEKPRGHRT